MFVNFCNLVGATMLPPQYYSMPGAPPPSWGVYPPQAGQHTPASGTPQPQLMRSQNTRSMTPQQQPTQQQPQQPDGYSASAVHTPGLITVSILEVWQFHLYSIMY